ncbi:hypothetical protein M0R45_011834 [Rubus argutus]|uniref:Uncharacterized protein n=1 Tax=Rubus argutus TaxID=59490 RepID=A0AAW1YB11_RUBAR
MAKFTTLFTIAALLLLLSSELTPRFAPSLLSPTTRSKPLNTKRWKQITIMWKMVRLAVQDWKSRSA